MTLKTNTDTTFDVDSEYDQLDEIVERQVRSNEYYQGNARFGIIGNANEQWAFVHSISLLSRERFNEVNFEAGLVEGSGFCVFNTLSKGAVVKFKGNEIKLSAQDLGFILGYRTALAKKMLAVSDAMYGCAKSVMSAGCFNHFFLMIDWQKINFYALFEIVHD
ncbi:MAG: hypothetical protein ACJAXJ_003535 [Colwellia sp.]|jgi:hypothetical protein